jgi:DNA modification methylase
VRVINQTTETAPIDALRPHPRNPRQGDIGAIHQSIEANGFYGTVIAQRSTGFILAGNHRWRAAQQDGADSIPVTWVDVDDDHALRILLADNRTNDLATYNDEALAELLKDLHASTGTLLGTGYDGDDLDELLAELGHDKPTDEAPEAQVDKADELREKWGTELGQLWRIGPHRIICGDSSDPAVLDRLIAGEKVGCVLTDPPYGINLDTNYSGMGTGSKNALFKAAPRDYRKVEGDDRPFDAAPLRTYFANVAEQFWFGANYYRRTLSDSDLDGSWLVWDKRTTEEADRMFGSGFELCWSANRHKQDLLRHMYAGAFGAEARDRMHPTQKPTGMLAEILNRWAPAGCVVADPFAGSGSHLIAAAKTGRAGYGVELDPAYVAVTLQRLADMGLTPELTDA